MVELINKDRLKYELFADNYNAKMTPQEVADCIDNQSTITESEIRAEVIDEFAYKVKQLMCSDYPKCPFNFGDIDEIAEQLKEADFSKTLNVPPLSM